MNDAWFHRIKAAQRDLIKLAGGIERAVEIASHSKSHVGRWNNPADPDLMPIGAILALESDTGRALVTAVMAETNGRRLSDPDDFVEVTGTVLSRHAEAVRQAGELMAQGALAFADGRVTTTEALAMDRAASALENATADLRSALARVRAKGGEGGHGVSQGDT